MKESERPRRCPFGVREGRLAGRIRALGRQMRGCAEADEWIARQI